MNEFRQSAAERLRTHEEKLRVLGIRSLSVPGSIARNKDGPASDTDSAVELDAAFARGGFAYLGKIKRLCDQPTGILGHPVDVIEEPVEPERPQRAIDQERIPAFGQARAAAAICRAAGCGSPRADPKTRDASYKFLINTAYLYSLYGGCIGYDSCRDALIKELLGCGEP